MQPRDATVIDLFSGVGGMSHGFQQAGYEIRAGYDWDATCADAFNSAHGTGKFHPADVLKVDGREISSHFDQTKLKVLIACCPCQPYSTLTRRPGRDTTDEQTTIDDFALQIADIDADVVVMENVPSLQAYKNGQTLALMLDSLAQLGYKVNASVVNAYWYGTPQRRKRLITIAARDAFVPEPPRVFSGSWSGEGEADGGPLLPGAEGPPRPSHRHAIGDLPALAAGEADPHDPMHVCSPANPLTLKRIMATPEGGDWRDWPPELREARYLRKYGTRPAHMMDDPYNSSFGRPYWDAPAYTLTTFFHRPSNGRFIHPRQERCYSAREGARLQGFPDDFAFIPQGKKFVMRRECRHIGNAVPPPLGKAIAEQIGRVLGI